MDILNRKGAVVRTGTPKNFANNWIAVDYTDGQEPRYGIVQPQQVHLRTVGEVRLFTNTNQHVVGSFWKTWSLLPNGRFEQRAPALRRRRSVRRVQKIFDA